MAFGTGPFGNDPFGDINFAETVLYDLLPSELRQLDATQPREWLREFLGLSFSVVNRIRQSISDYPTLRQPRNVRGRTDEDTRLLTLGREVVPKGRVTQQGTNARVLSVGVIITDSGSFTDSDRGARFEVTGGAQNDFNAREFVVAGVLNRREVILDPPPQLDGGPIRWRLQRALDRNPGEVEVEVVNGDILAVNRAWDLFDGRRRYPVVGREIIRTLSESRPRPIDRTIPDCIIDSEGRIFTEGGRFNEADIGKPVSLLGVVGGGLNIFRIATLYGPQTAALGRVFDRRVPASLDPQTQIIEMTVLPFTRLRLKANAPPAGVALQDGVRLTVVDSVTVTVEASAARFSPDDVGRYIEIVGSRRGNDGVYEIENVLGPERAQLLNTDGTTPALVPDDGNKWYLREALEDTGSDNEVRAARTELISTLGNDFGLKVDLNETDVGARRWVESSLRWADRKGTAKAYEVIARMTGFTAEASPLWAVSPDFVLGGIIANDVLVEVGDAEDAGGDGALVAGGLNTLFTSVDTDFFAGDVGRWVRISGAATPGNNDRFLIAEVIDDSTLRLDPRTIPPVVPDANNGSLQFTVQRLYSTLPPLRPNFDESLEDVLADIVEDESGGAQTFDLDLFCWQDDFGSDVPVTITAVTEVAPFEYEVSIESNTTTPRPDAPEVVTAIGNWRVYDANGDPFTLESLPTGGPPAYTTMVRTDQAPALGDGFLRLECVISPSCDYCAASAVLIRVAAAEVASADADAVNSALTRLFDRFDLARPVHVRLVPIITNEILCGYGTAGDGVGLTFEAGADTGEVLASYSLYFDEALLGGSLEGDVDLDEDVLHLILEPDPGP